MPDPVLDIVNFSHICIAVSDMERSLEWYGRVLGVEVVFDVELSGAALESVTGDVGAQGRMVGMRIPGSGVVVELLCFGHGRSNGPSQRPTTGYTNISVTVSDVEVARTELTKADEPCGPVADFDGVRMVFVSDPDGTPIEIVEYPHGATSNLEYQQRR